MPAIAIHHTETDDRSWDAGRNVANARSGESRAYYARIFAWRDPEADDSTKGAYKFPHHLVGADGEPGAASIRGCQSGIGVLNGAMGGADIPDSDRRGVYRHLAAHLEDAEIEPAELRQAPDRAEGIERRVLQLGELRVMAGTEEDPRDRVVGYAALFGVTSENLGGFREVIHPGTFAKTIQEADVRALQNHDPNLVLGRNRAGTLELTEDDRGLAFTIWPPDTTWAKDLLLSMRRGDIDQGSFGFETIRDSWEGDSENGVTRHLYEVRLYDISVVTFPAYAETSAEVRAKAKAILASPAPGQEAHGGGQGEGIDLQGRRSRNRARLELARRRQS